MDYEFVMIAKAELGVDIPPEKSIRDIEREVEHIIEKALQNGFTSGECNYVVTETARR